MAMTPRTGPIGEEDKFGLVGAALPCEAMRSLT